MNFLSTTRKLALVIDCHANCTTNFIYHPVCHCYFFVYKKSPADHAEHQARKKRGSE